MSFNLSENLFVTGKPYHITPGDYNGDDNTDLAVSLSDGSNNVVILFGRSNGTFSNDEDDRTYIPTGNNPVGLASGDLNDDGIDDLVITCADDDSLQTIFGHTDHEKIEVYETLSAGGSEPRYVNLCDFNQDGMLDIINTCSQCNLVQILYNKPLNSPPYPKILFEDDFEDGQISSDWQVQDGAWSIENGKLKGIGSGGGVDGLIYAGEDSWTDYSVEADVDMAGGNCEFFLRSTGHLTNEYRIQIFQHDHIDYPNRYAIFKYQGNVGSTLVDSNADGKKLIPGIFRIKLSVSGNTISLEIDGVHIDTVTDPNPLTSGKFGPGVIWRDTAYFDNIVVRDLSNIGMSGTDLPDGPDGMIWVHVDDPGVSGHEPFIGLMSKYETTNAQYCQFLNAAFISEDISVVDSSYIVGADGLNSGVDYVDQQYYNLLGPGGDFDEITNGGKSRIQYDGNSFTVETGFEDHPVTYVSLYGAMAFCNYYGYRLPTEWEWQAVADYKEPNLFNYGCGVDIDNSKANYKGSVHPYGTTPVGEFGDYGYRLCDMAGNVWEWTTSLYDGYDRTLRGGDWHDTATNCTVNKRGYHEPSFWHELIGFRVCNMPSESNPNIVYNTSSSHYYESVAESLTWEQAKIAAELRIYKGMQGHLATVTSEEENSFIVDHVISNNYYYWLGGFQPEGTPEPPYDNNWQWVTGEIWDTEWDKWNTNEPNDDQGCEDWLALMGDDHRGYWNDTKEITTAHYVVEYE